MSTDLERRRSLLSAAALGFALVDTKGKPALRRRIARPRSPAELRAWLARRLEAMTLGSFEKRGATRRLLDEVRSYGSPEDRMNLIHLLGDRLAYRVWQLVKDDAGQTLWGKTRGQHGRMQSGLVQGTQKVIDDLLAAIDQVFDWIDEREQSVAGRLHLALLHDDGLRGALPYLEQARRLLRDQPLRADPRAPKPRPGRRRETRLPLSLKVNAPIYRRRQLEAKVRDELLAIRRRAGTAISRTERSRAKGLAKQLITITFKDEGKKRAEIR